MPNLETIAKVPGVKSAVLGDLEGVLLGAMREQDGETAAAVMGFASSAFRQAGDLLGLGALRGVSIGGQTCACVVAVEGSSVLAAQVEPPSSLSAVEKALDAALQRKE